MKIILVDDHTLVRKGLIKLISDEPNMTIVGEADDGREAVNLVRKHTPDIVVMDINMPEMNGVLATRQIIKEFPETKVLALSMHSDARFITSALKAGAHGYLLKDCAVGDLVNAIRAIMSGKTYLHDSVNSVQVAALMDDDNIGKNKLHPLLSNRELEVLTLVSEGRNTKGIALTLFVSIKTIESHRKNIMDKLNLHNVAELTKYAIREGITQVELTMGNF